MTWPSKFRAKSTIGIIKIFRKISLQSVIVNLDLWVKHNLSCKVSPLIENKMGMVRSMLAVFTLLPSTQKPLASENACWPVQIIMESLIN
jgi:hypothetical protein